MNRYIDASILESTIDKYSERLLSHKLIPILCEAVRGVLDDIRFMVKIQQSINVIPVVRCSECKYASFSASQGETYISCGNAEGLFRDVPEDGYCYCGEKADE